MGRKLGEVFEVDGVKLQVVEASDTFSCDGKDVCGFQNCLRCERTDNKSVKFVMVYD